MSRKVNDVVKEFNRINSNVFKASKSISLDETLAPFHGRNGIHTKMPRKPAGEGMCYNNVSYAGFRFSESIILQRTATENRWDKPKLIDKMIGNKFKDQNMLMTTDRGYSNVLLIRHCIENKILFLGTIQKRFLSGNYPLFPDDDTARKRRQDPSHEFTKRVYYYKIKDESIYLR